MPGRSFTAKELRSAGDQTIKMRRMADGMELGVHYAVDPDLKVRSGGKPDHHHDCNDAARDMLDCLDSAEDE